MRSAHIHPQSRTRMRARDAHVANLLLTGARFAAMLYVGLWANFVSNANSSLSGLSFILGIPVEPLVEPDPFTLGIVAFLGAGFSFLPVLLLWVILLSGTLPGFDAFLGSVAPHRGLKPRTWRQIWHRTWPSWTLITLQASFVIPSLVLTQEIRSTGVPWCGKTSTWFTIHPLVCHSGKGMAPRIVLWLSAMTLPASAVLVMWPEALFRNAHKQSVKPISSMPYELRPEECMPEGKLSAVYKRQQATCNTLSSTRNAPQYVNDADARFGGVGVTADMSLARKQTDEYETMPNIVRLIRRFILQEASASGKERYLKREFEYISPTNVDPFYIVPACIIFSMLSLGPMIYCATAAWNSAGHDSFSTAFFVLLMATYLITVIASTVGFGATWLRHIRRTYLYGISSRQWYRAVKVWVLVVSIDLSLAFLLAFLAVGFRLKAGPRTGPLWASSALTLLSVLGIYFPILWLGGCLGRPQAS